MLSLCLGAILLGLSRRLFRDGHRAALLATLAIILFFSYGHIYGFLEPVAVLGEVVGRHRYLGVVWALLGVFGLLRILHLREPRRLTSTINAAALALLILPAVQIVSYDSRLRQADQAAVPAAATTSSSTPTPAAISWRVPTDFSSSYPGWRANTSS